MLLPDGTKLNGIFQYNPSVTFTETDLVVYNLILYTVVKEVTNEIPSGSSSYEDYALYNSVKTLEEYQNSQTTSRPVPSNLIKPIINSYIGGFKGDRQVVTLDNGFDLNLITDNYKAFVRIDCLNLPLNLNSNTHYVLSCYKSDKVICQELLDYTTPNIYLRYLDNSTFPFIWSGWNSLAPITGLDILGQQISGVQEQIQGLKSAYKEFADNSDTFFSKRLLFNGQSLLAAIPPGTSPDSLLYIEISNLTNKEIITTSIFNGQRSVLGGTLTISLDFLTISLTSSDCFITKVYIS